MKARESREADRGREGSGWVVFQNRLYIFNDFIIQIAV